MAIITVWQSADGDWDNNASWSGGVPPANGDTVIFPANNSVSVTSNQDGQGAVDLAALLIQPGYVGNIGSSGTHLIISADRIVHEGSGTLFYTDGAGTTDNVIVNAVGNAAAATFSGTSLTRIVVLGGKVTLDGSIAAVANLEVSYVNAMQSDAEVIIENGAGTITTLLMSGGIVSSSAVITTAYVSGGILIQVSTGGAITTLYCLGGTVRYNTVSTLGEAQVLAGALDCRATKPSGASTLTISLLRVHAGAKAFIPTDLVTVTAGGSLLERVEYGDS